MFFILELQVDENGVGSVLPAHTKEDRNEAESVYYSVLASAAISKVKHHGAILLNEDCVPIMYYAYRHLNEE